MALATLEIRRSSASLRGEKTGIRELPVVAKYIDTSTCIGCKACEVACQEWNDLEAVKTEQVGSYQTLPSLDPNLWNLIRFREQELEGGGLAWLMRKDQCMHCADPGCLEACPAPGAIVQYVNGIVDVNPEACIGCGLCETGCPFNVPRLHAKTGKMAKCTLCVDRASVGLEPACIKACPTGCLQFGSKETMVAAGNERVKQLKANGFPEAVLYDPPGVGGTGVVTVLAHGDHPDWYGLPKDPHVPLAVRFSKSILKPLGFAGVIGMIGAVVGHYMAFGPSEAVAPQREAPEPEAASQAVARARHTEDVLVGDEVVRHRLSTRVIHWTVAVSFFVALLSGLPIWTPIFGWMAHLFGGLAVCRWLHPWSGIAFAAAMAVMFVHWISQMRFEPQDRGWFGRKLRSYAHGEAEDPEVGRYNAGQKLLFYLVALLALLLLLSGVVLWFPYEFGEDLRQASWVLHDAMFLVFAATIVVHIYLGTAGEPGTFRTMTRGTATKAWARLHHPRWYRAITGERRTDRP
jgi:formate dehydrogenase beta subunit/formate dehydrogenase gamma subunit